MQELDQAGEWESMLASAGVINSPADYPGTGRQGKPGSGSSEGSDVAGGAKGG